MFSNLKILEMEKYHLIQQIGEGSFGRVYKARRKYTSRMVAIKMIGKKGQTAFDILRLLIVNGFAVNGVNPDSPSLLDAFAKSLYKNYEAIELLLQNDANMLAPCSIKRNNVNTIYEYVMSSKDDKMKKLFQKYHK